MSSGKTEHYSLHQWEAGDNFLRGEFNENFAQIDAAVAGKASIAAGSYTGDGKLPRTISLGFRPKAVYVEDRQGTRDYHAYYGGLILDGSPGRYGSIAMVEITDDGFQLYNASGNQLNVKGTVYHYIAVQFVAE